MKKTGRLLICLLAIGSISSCYKDKTTAVNAAECPTIISYSMDIVPIIHSSCMTNLGPGSGCHDDWITSYNNIKAYCDSKTLQTQVLINHTMPQMPNDFGIDSLTAEELQLMDCWIQQGYPEN